MIGGNWGVETHGSWCTLGVEVSLSCKFLPNYNKNTQEAKYYVILKMNIVRLGKGYLI